MPNPDAFGVLYLMVFRVSIVMAGVISILCGYRLFLAGAFRVPPGVTPTEISGKFSSAQFTLKSLAPGTCFALFGALVIGTMIVSAPPEFERSRMASTLPSGEMSTKEASKMRGQATNIVESVEQAKWYEQQGHTQKAIETYERALWVIAEPLNNLAWLYHKTGHDHEALLLAHLATQFAPNVMAFTDTLNTIRGRDRKE